MQLAELVAYLDRYLDVGAVPDAPHALNGLQVGNSGAVTHLAAAVDLCDATFWGGLRPLVGPHYLRVARLVRHDIALYSAHLPLDRHPEVGNNALLARALAVARRGEFGEEFGKPIGVWGELSMDRDALVERLGVALGVVPRLLAFGPKQVRRVGIVTGAGGSLIPQVAAAGLDTYITGEGPHHTFFDAEELRVNVIYAGHYATETVGVKALTEHVSAKFQLPWTFLDHPTGL
ncbi:MAG: hypothetical protein AUH42_05490 [Gemmatimonadetes bacterium 13_1_40CM_70_11]|nr:MAG: hypothetical protein AUH42_05490 [Gemmatimonadetes bacterium 13_1_40CM_70_11]